MKSKILLSILVLSVSMVILSACSQSQEHSFFKGTFNPGWESDLYTYPENSIDFAYNEEEKIISGVGKYVENKLSGTDGDPAWTTTFLYDFVGNTTDGVQFSGKTRLVMTTTCTAYCDTHETQVLYGGWYGTLDESTYTFKGDFTDIISIPFTLANQGEDMNIDYYEWDGTVE